MAKLDPEHQEQTANASSGFAPVPAGTYHLRLREVDPENEGPAGPYWKWEFEILDDIDYEWEVDGEMAPQNTKGSRLWNNTSLSKQAAFKMKETYDAFGAELDADTDDMCGAIVRAEVSQQTIQGGARKGQIGNQIDRLFLNDGFEADGEPVAAGAGKKKGQPDAENIF
jgi:hypothetical protein